MASAVELWGRLKPLIRNRMSFTPDAWRSVEAAVPIVLEGDTLVLGLAPENEALRSHLETRIVFSLIRQLVKEVTGKEVEVILVIGTTEEDWQRYKTRQEYLRQLSERTAETTGIRAVEMAERDWRWLTSQVSQAYATLHQRQYDYVKAQFLLDWAEKIADFEEEYLSRHPGKQEEMVKELERLTQRLAGMVNMTPSMVAIEIERTRRKRKQLRQT